MKNVISASCGPKHHFFGFHDLVAFNKSDDKLLSLEVDVINRPPLPNEYARVGYINLYNHDFVALGTTNAFNYPQGARQQWISDDLFIVNNQVGDNWGADVYDVSLRRKVDSFESTCHALSKDGKKAFGLNYSRLHRLGGYGYVGIEDFSANDNMPSNDGIFVTDLIDKETKLLISIKDVASCSENINQVNGCLHYLTHISVCPNNQRLAFLHRFILPDGGLRTRLMTIGVNGDGLRCLAEGFLSHFDWKDEETLFIYGRLNTSVDKLRTSTFLRNTVLSKFARDAKCLLKPFLRKAISNNMSFLLVKDKLDGEIRKVAEGIITSDGHPMFCPTNNDLIICDTYPDKEKCRDLFLYDFKLNKRTGLDRFRMSDEQVDKSMSAKHLSGIDSKVLNVVASPDLFSFTRSGLHCDLHPRWNFLGTKVAFDSIHQGTRQIYICEIE